MITILSVITSVKDYIEIVHKLVESNSINSINNYYDLGAIATYIILSTKELLIKFFNFSWLTNIGSLPILIPDIASSLISEISILDNYFHNAFTFLETPISYGDNNYLFLCLEKFTIGFINSIFLCLPTSTAHIITLRRFVMQGLEAGYIAGLGTITGNVLWIGSIIFGLRFIVIPWLSLDIFRYLLGFILLVKYMWDSYSERKNIVENLSKWKIFLLNFLLAFTEQTNIYPFISNLSLGSDSTIIESFPATNFLEFFSIHSFYLLGIIIGSLSLLQLTCWFWENPALNLYMWMISSFKVTTGLYYKILNFFFLYLIMICSISNIAYFGLDYTITNPIGLVHEDRIVDQKILLETSFLNTKASDRNTRRNRGRHGRRERWKRRVRRYRTFDSSLYDQGIYDLFTIEDLNYGFDRFWLRRKIRNHRVRFRFFPGPWMRSFKKQLARPRLESFMGPRVEFFRILFEQVYHPEFHEFRSLNNSDKNKKTINVNKNNSNLLPLLLTKEKQIISIYLNQTSKEKKQNLRAEFSALRKFVRKVNTRINTSKIVFDLKNNYLIENHYLNSTKPIYSKKWKQIFSKISHQTKSSNRNSLLIRFYNRILNKKSIPSTNNIVLKDYQNNQLKMNNFLLQNNEKKDDFRQKMSKKDRQILRYKTFLTEISPNLSIENFTTIKNNDKNKNLNRMSNLELLNSQNILNETSSDLTQKNINTNYFQNEKNMNSTKLLLNNYRPLTLLHPIKFYLQKEQAFQRKLKFYGTNIFRNFQIENNAPHFRTLMRRFFYYYKPTLRWERTMHIATMRKARRKGIRIPRKLNIDKKNQILSTFEINSETSDFKNQNFEKNFPFQENTNQSQIQKPTHFYSLVSKRASRYRYQIYKDLLEHWYYSPFNRLLLKFDVDSFIRRQPFSHFLTKNEENLLNLRRFLLHEYYETLRWYTYMQHYRSMKTHIGGTKSFANRLYNQQFQGTFKKIRHLFAITPTSTEIPILKFDQPLYNEFYNNQNSSILENSILHGELLTDEDIYNKDVLLEMAKFSQTPFGKIEIGNDLQNQSKKIIREYLIKSKPIKENLIRDLISEKNYWELTQFLYNGNKTRGSNPSTNEKSFLTQEKNYLFNQVEKQKLNEFFQKKINQNKSIDSFEQDLWFHLIKKSQNQLYNQESLKLYLSRHVDKHQKQKQRQEKYFKQRLERLKIWLIEKKQNNGKDYGKNNLPGLTTSIQKSLKDGIYFQKNWTKIKTNTRNNRMNINWNNFDSNLFNKNSPKSKKFANSLKNRQKFYQFQILQIEKDIQNKVSLIKKLQNQDQKNDLSSMGQINSININFQKIIFLMKKTLTPFTFISKLSFNEILKKPFSVIQDLWIQTPEKDFEIWRKQENILTKRKKIRKTLKRLRNTNTRNLIGWEMNDLLIFKSKNNGNKLDLNEDILNSNNKQRVINSWKKWNHKLSDLFGNSSKINQNSKFNFINFLNDKTQKKFKRKRSRLRRYRRMKGRGPIKKRTLGEKLKRQFRLLKRYSRTTIDQNFSQTLETRSDKKVEIFKLITKRKYEPESEFKVRDLKQRRVRQRKQRFWKKHKKQKYAQNKRKQRKRRRYALGKIRVLNKELKRIKANIIIKKWWWEVFLPNLKANQEILDQIEIKNQLQNKLSKMSLTDILERDTKVLENYRERIEGENILQIGIKDFKPLSTPEALRIRENFEKNNNLLNTTQIRQELNSTLQSKFGDISFLQEKNINAQKFENKTEKINLNNESFPTIIGKITQNLLIENNTSNLPNSNAFLVAVNPTPFYTGWDETLRKFVVTNRLLSNKEANYLIKLNLKNSSNLQDKSNLLPSNLKSLFKNLDAEREEKLTFSEAPLKGMNAATTLYWQIPFTTYDPDQFFALGMDGFSPIGWKKFHFRHSKETTKPLLVKSKTFGLKISENSNFEFKIQTKILENQSRLFKSKSFLNYQNKKNQYRNIQKRYKKVKKHPRPPVWFPSGPLTNQVLPVHYIYVFYKRYRLPRDRYIRRRLRKTKDSSSLSVYNSIQNINDFTLRRRVKPKRKYHRKTNLRKNDQLFLKRRKFISNIEINYENKISRPSSKNLTVLDEQSLLKTKLKQNRKINQKQAPENLRVRQLRRRIQRQVIRTTWRYRPRAGGFTWPGDYLRLELVRAPKLNLVEKTVSQSKTLTQRKLRKKKRRSIQEWQIQPKKYLLQKHNIQIFKNRLRNTNNSYKIQQRIKLLEY